MINQDLFRVKNSTEKRQSVFFAALSGFMASTTAAVSSSFINIWLFPDIPLYLDLKSVFISWILWAVLGGVLAGIAGLSSEGWKSILLSALSMTITILIINFIQSSESIMLRMVAVVGLLFPLTAMISPLALLFFWLSYRFVQGMLLKGWARAKIFVLNFIVILVIGTLPGLYVKFDNRTEQAVRLIHGILQELPDTTHKALLKTNGFSDHMRQAYTLSQRPSLYSTAGVDVTAHYDDGYTIICTVVLYPGSDPSVFPCKGVMP